MEEETYEEEDIEEEDTDEDKYLILEDLLDIEPLGDYEHKTHFIIGGNKRGY